MFANGLVVFVFMYYMCFIDHRVFRGWFGCNGSLVCSLIICFFFMAYMWVHGLFVFSLMNDWLLVHGVCVVSWVACFFSRIACSFMDYWFLSWIICFGFMNSVFPWIISFFMDYWCLFVSWVMSALHVLLAVVHGWWVFHGLCAVSLICFHGVSVFPWVMISCHGWLVLLVEYLLFHELLLVVWIMCVVLAYISDCFVHGYLFCMEYCIVSRISCFCFCVAWLRTLFPWLLFFQRWYVFATECLFFFTGYLLFHGL